MLQGMQLEQAPHATMALGHPVFAPVQLDDVPLAGDVGAAALGAAGGQPPASEHILQLNGGVFLPPRGARGPRREQSSAEDEDSSAAATDGSEMTHAWVRSLKMHLCSCQVAGRPTTFCLALNSATYCCPQGPTDFLPSRLQQPGSLFLIAVF